MKCKTMAVALAVTAACVATNASATQWYDFTLSGNDMMPTWRSLQWNQNDTQMTPRDLGYVDGSRRLTPKPSSGLPDDMRTYGDYASSDNFLDWYRSSTDRLSQFNLWGYGGTDAYGWGEDFLVEAWGYNADSSSAAWDTYMTYDSAATGVVLNWWTNTGWNDGLAIGATDNPMFTFSLGLADDFNNWSGGQEGSLVFWFGGDMLNPNNQQTGTLQGNIVLSGAAHDANPVPEPATMLLFGTGLVGLAGLRRKKKYRHVGK